MPLRTSVWSSASSTRSRRPLMRRLRSGCRRRPARRRRRCVRWSAARRARTPVRACRATRCGDARLGGAAAVVLDRQAHRLIVARHVDAGRRRRRRVGPRWSAPPAPPGRSPLRLRGRAAGWRSRRRAPTAMRVRAAKSSASARSAGTSPRSSSTDGRSRLLTSRTCARARPTIAPASMRPSSSSSILTAVSTWPASSCSSWAMRRRSSSCTRSISPVSCSSSKVRSARRSRSLPSTTKSSPRPMAKRNSTSANTP